MKLLLDAVGSATIGDEILKILDDGGCQLAWFNPIGWYTLGRFNYRTHRKSLIIDGCVAFTGGAGIADHWRGCAQDPEHWRDMQIRIEGPAVDAAADRLRAELAADDGGDRERAASSSPARSRRARRRCRRC